MEVKVRVLCVRLKNRGYLTVMVSNAKFKLAPVQTQPIRPKVRLEYGAHQRLNMLIAGGDLLQSRISDTKSSRSSPGFSIVLSLVVITVNNTIMLVSQYMPLQECVAGLEHLAQVQYHRRRRVLHPAQAVRVD